MNEELKRQTKKGVLWSAAQRFSTQGLQFLTTIVLANFLGPAEYGTIGMLSIFMGIASVFIDGGFVNALTRKTNRSHTDICTVFYTNISISFVAYFILFISAPLVAKFYEMPELCLIVRIYSIALIIGSFSSVQATLLTIKLDFKSQTQISVVSLITSAIIGVLLAYKGFSYWALVIQTIIGTFISTILYWYYSSWRPSLTFSGKSFNEMFTFGSKFLATMLLNNAYNNIYPLVIGKYFSASTLGNYSRAESYANFPSNSLTGMIQRVTYPILCAMQDNDKELAHTYRNFLGLSAFIIFPLMMGLSALSYPFIIILIGSKWSDCVIMLQILCFALMWFPILSINQNLLLVKGRSDLLLKLEIANKVIGVVTLCISLPWGIIILCWSRLALSLISLLINTYYTEKLINYGFIKQMKDISPTFFISISMWGIITFVNSLINNVIVQLVTGILLGFFFYMIASYLFNRHEFRMVYSLIRK